MKKLIALLLTVIAFTSFFSCRDKQAEPTPAELAVAMAEEGRVEDAYYALKALAEAGDEEAEEKLGDFSLVYTTCTESFGHITNGELVGKKINQTKFTYNNEGYLLTYESDKGSGKTCVKSFYDDQGYLVREESVYSTDVYSYSYDDNGNLTKYLHTHAGIPRNVVEYVYGESNKLIKKSYTNRYEKTTVSEYAYDKNGNTVYESYSEQNGSVRTVERSYDGDSRLLKETSTSADGSVRSVEYEYASGKHPIKETDSSGNRIDYVYDGEGRLVSKIDIGRMTAYHYFYDEHGNLTKETENERNKNFFTYLYEYDDNGNLTKKVWGDDPDTAEQYEEYVYDGRGNLLKKTSVYPSMYGSDDFATEEYEGYKIYYHPNKPKIPDIEY